MPAIVFLGIWFVMQFLSGAVTTAGAESGGVAVWGARRRISGGRGAVFRKVEWGKLQRTEG